MTAAEEYTAHHAESLHTIMYEWGWRTFEGMFRRHLLRKAREEVRHLRDLRLAALDANMNFDSPDNTQAKQQRVDSLMDNYNQAMRALDPSRADQQEEADPAAGDPLLDPVARRAYNLAAAAERPLAPQAGMGRQLLEATS